MAGDDILGLIQEAPPVPGVEKPCRAIGWGPRLHLLEWGLPGAADPSVSPGSAGESCEPENCLGSSLAQEAQLHCSDSDVSWLQNR